MKECAAAAREQAEADVDWIEGECARLWRSVAPRAKDRLGLELGDFEPVRELLAAANAFIGFVAEHRCARG